MKALKCSTIDGSIYRHDDTTAIRIEALWYRLSGIHNSGCAQHNQGMVVPCIAAYMLLEQCMSRPYPVGEKVFFTGWP